MISARTLLLGAMLVSLTAAPAVAQAGQQKPKGRPDAAQAAKGKAREVGGDAELRIAREYFSKTSDKPKPLPPGIAKNLARGKPLPPASPGPECQMACWANFRRWPGGSGPWWATSCFSSTAPAWWSTSWVRFFSGWPGSALTVRLYPNWR